MKKMLSLLLALLLLASSFAACSESGTNEEANDTASDTNEVDASEVEVVVEEETRTKHQVPDNLDFDGSTFMIGYPAWQGYNEYFFATEKTGDVMNDACFDRMAYVDDYLNVDIQQTDCGYIADVVNVITASIASGDDAYQMALLHCIQGVSTFGSQNYMYNLDDLPYIDTTADWWNQAMMDELRLGSRTIYGVSDYMIPCPYCIFFNKDVIEDYQFDNPYELVYEGTWTLDKYVQMTLDGTIDLDGDGVISDNDIYGTGAEEGSKYIAFMTSCGQFMTSRGEDGRVELDMNTEKMLSIVETLHGILAKEGSVYGDPSVETYECHTLFSSGKILFMLHALSGATTYRDAEIDVGIVPYPKYDEAQENYLSLDWGGLMCVPGTITNPDMVGAVIELLSYKSADTVIPAYYDVLLNGKVARDEDTVKMFDIMFDNIVYEIGGNYFGFSGGTGDLFYTLPRLVIIQDSTDFASWYKSKEKVASATIKAFYKQLDKSENS